MTNELGTATKNVKSMRDNFRETGQERKSKSAKQPEYFNEDMGIL